MKRARELLPDLRYTAPPARPQGGSLTYLPSSMRHFRAALRTGDAATVVATYPNAVSSLLLEPFDTAAYVALLYQQLKPVKGAGPRRIYGRDELVALVEKLIVDIRNDVAPSHSSTSYNILAFCIDAGIHERGRDFLDWLARTDYEYLGLGGFGRAIELSLKLGTSIEETEVLYTKALRKSLDAFSGQGLAPKPEGTDGNTHAGQENDILLLLQMIALARLHFQRPRQAYQALDTSFRLSSGKEMGGICNLFIHHRPLPEAFKIFMIACRSGAALKGSVLVKLQIRMSNAAIRKDSLFARYRYLSAMSDALHAYVRQGGILEGQSMALLAKVLLFVDDFGLRNQDDGGYDDGHDGKGPVSFAWHIGQLLMRIALHALDRPQALYSQLAILAAKVGSKKFYSSLLTDATKNGLVTNNDMQMNFMRAAGRLKDIATIETLWNMICANVKPPATAPVRFSWLLLRKATDTAGHPTMYLDQVHKLNPTEIFDPSKERMRRSAERINPKLQTARKVRVDATAERCAAFRVHILKQVEGIAALLTGKDSKQQSSDIDVSCDLVPARQLASPEHLRRLFQENEAEQSKGLEKIDASLGPGVDHTVDELRFQNWVALSELLAGFETKSEAATPGKTEEEQLQVLGSEAAWKEADTAAKLVSTDYMAIRQEINALRARPDDMDLAAWMRNMFKAI